MVSRANIHITIAVLAVVAGCSSDGDESLPNACRAGDHAVRAALEGAPEAVELESTPLSGCLVKSSNPAEIQEVGGTYLAVAAELAAVAARRPDGSAALRLGYLVGAVRRGAAATQGIHNELVRRIEQEAAPAAASDAYSEGVRAGQASG